MIRIEMADAHSTGTQVFDAGTVLGEDEIEEGKIALSFNANIMFVLVGTRDELIVKLTNALHLIANKGGT